MSKQKPDSLTEQIKAKATLGVTIAEVVDNTDTEEEWKRESQRKWIPVEDVLAIIEPLMAHLQPENRPQMVLTLTFAENKVKLAKYFEELDKHMGVTK